jgi:hypothetical protein
MKKSVKKKLAALLLGLVKRFLSGNSGQKKVAGVHNMFKLMVAQIQTGIEEQQDDARDTQEQIDELMALSNQQDHKLSEANRLIRKLQEITD